MGDATSSEGVSLENKEKGIDARDNNRATPLMLAAGGGQPQIVEMLVEAGANLEAQDEFGLRPLHYAAESGHESAVEALLTLGANPDSEDETGKTAAEIARAWGFPKVAEIFGPTASISDAAPELAAGAPPPSSTDGSARRMPDNLQPEKMEL